MGYSTFRPLGVTHQRPSRVDAGFTLVTTIDSTFACLIDMDGRVVHHWRLPLPAFYAYLLDNGHLLAALKIDRPAVRFGGMYGLAAELDWDGNVVWQYEDNVLHHDLCRLRNGNTMLLRWAQIPAEIHRRVAGGRPGTEAEGDVMWGDELLEVTPTGQTVWHWKSYEVFDPVRDAMCPLEFRYEWSHCNAVEELADGDLTVSFRRLDTVAILDRESGRFRWQWGRDELAHQHDPTELPSGNLLIFDNGIHRPGGMERSRLVEVDPRTDRIAWEYVARPESSFYSRNISGAQRLTNGNSLACEGDCGRLFEVTPDGEIVWEYHNPFFSDSPVMGHTNRMFRAHRYGPDDPVLAGRRPNTTACEWLNRAAGLL